MTFRPLITRLDSERKVQQDIDFIICNNYFSHGLYASSTQLSRSSVISEETRIRQNSHYFIDIYISTEERGQIKPQIMKCNIEVYSTTKKCQRDRKTAQNQIKKVHKRNMKKKLTSQIRKYIK